MAMPQRYLCFPVCFCFPFDLLLWFIQRYWGKGWRNRHTWIFIKSSYSQHCAWHCYCGLKYTLQPVSIKEPWRTQSEIREFLGGHISELAIDFRDFWQVPVSEAEQKCSSTHPLSMLPQSESHCTPTPVTLVLAVKRGYSLPRLLPLLLFVFASPSPVLLTKEICRLKGLQLWEFPWQQPPWRSLLLAKTLISQSGYCCFSPRFTNRRRGKKNGGEERKSLLLARKERRN